MDQRKFNRRRSSKLSAHDRCAIMSYTQILRVPDGLLTAPRIARKAGVADIVHNRSLRTVLNNSGCKYSQSRKKELFRQGDLHARLEFSLVSSSKPTQRA